jgi:tRNA threonylcarbamoyladenosine biosynthesis protein TsaB
MRILAIECATETAGVALAVDGEVRERRSAGEKHGAFLLPAVAALLAEAGLERGALDGVAVGRGPGAFTGVRFGLAVAQGLALGLDRPVLAVSTLAALALQAATETRSAAGTSVLALLDARMDEVYGGAFELGGSDLVRPLGEEFLRSPGAVQAPQGEPLLVAGSGLAAHRSSVAAALGARKYLAAADAWPSATAVARLALPGFAAGLAGPPERLAPVYLRDKVALTESERGR